MDTFVIFATTSNSFTLSLTRNGLKAIPKSTATACGLSIVIKVIHEIFSQKYKNFKEQYEKGQQTIESFNMFCRKTFKDNVIDKNEHDSLGNIFTEYLEETEKESPLKI